MTIAKKLGMTPVHVAQSNFMEAMAEEGFIDSDLCLKPHNAVYIQQLLDKLCKEVQALPPSAAEVK